MSPFSGNYPSTDRKAIWLALFNHLKAISTLSALIETFGRRLVQPPTLEQVQMPGLFVLQVAEEKKAGPRRLPGKLTLHGMLIIYVCTATNTIKRAALSAFWETEGFIRPRERTASRY
jgi:hypothetical protein